MPLLVAVGLLGCTHGATPESSGAGSDKADSANPDLTFTCKSSAGASLTALLPRSHDEVTITRGNASKPLPIFSDDDLEIATDLTFSDRVASGSGGLSSLIAYRMLIGNGDSKSMNAQLLVTTIDNTVTPATLQTEVFSCRSATAGAVDGGADDGMSVDTSPVDCGPMSCGAHQACVQDFSGNGGPIPAKRCEDIPTGCTRADLCSCLMSLSQNNVCKAATSSNPDACQDDTFGHVTCDLL
jgi:hypothetical protein